MPNIVTATLNGLPCLSAEYRRNTGAAPSTAAVTLRAADATALLTGPAALVLSDDLGGISVGLLSIAEISADETLARVALTDRRVSWKARVNGERKGATLGALVDELLAALGEVGMHELRRADEIAPAQIWNDAPAATALETLLAQFGQSYIIDDDDNLRAVNWDALILPQTATLECTVIPAPAVGRLAVISDVELTEIIIEGDWETVCEDDAGNLRPLADVLAEWGVDEVALRAAVLREGGVRALVADEKRAGLLERYAYRCYRVPPDAREWLPLIARRMTAEGELAPALVEHTGFRAKLRNVPPLADPWESQVDFAPEPGPVEIDGERGTVHFARIVGHLAPLSPPVHDTTLENRELAEPPKIRLTALTRTNTQRELASAELAEHGTDYDIRRGELAAYFTSTQTTPEPANIAVLQVEAALVLDRVQAALPVNVTAARLAGAHAIWPQPGGVVVVTCGDTGLMTRLLPHQDVTRWMLQTFSTPARDYPLRDTLPGACPFVRRHLNAYRTGPLLLRASGTANESESYIAAQATAYDAALDKVSIDKLAPLRTPFHLAHVVAGKAGGWFVAAPVRLTAAGLQLMADGTALSPDFAPQTAEPLGDGLLPQKSEGLLLQALDGETMLVLYDRPLVAQHRGNRIAEYSVEVRDISGDELDDIKRGGLQFPIVISLSYSHMIEGVGGTPEQPGWTPNLNLKDLDSGTQDDFERAGRGLFTELTGFDLGRLAHLPLQGGPIMADARHCTKHRYGEAIGPDGTYVETAGHISTDGFFKIPGSEQFDAPFLFQQELTSVQPPLGPEFRAEIKLHTDFKHPWNHLLRDNRWVVTYRWPLFDSEPPDWKPSEKPRVSEKNLVAPSFDWAPPPSTGEPVDAVDYPGIAIKAVGYAPEPISGKPDPSLGGGCVYFPSDVDLASGAPWVSAVPKRYVVFHPNVGVALGLPNLAGDGAPVSGVRLTLDGANNLAVNPVNAAGATDGTKLLDILGGLRARKDVFLGEAVSGKQVNLEAPNLVFTNTSTAQKSIFPQTVNAGFGLNLAIRAGNTNTGLIGGILTLDAGAAAITNGAVGIGTSVASAVSIGRSTITTTIAGTLFASGHARVGSAADDVNTGDFVAGLAGAARAFFSQSAAQLSLFNASGIEKTRLSAAGDSFFENALHVRGQTQDYFKLARGTVGNASEFIERRGPVVKFQTASTAGVSNTVFALSGSSARGVRLEVKIVGLRDDGSGMFTEQWIVAARNNAGVVSQTASVQDSVTNGTFIAPSVSFGVSGANVRCTITPSSALASRWEIVTHAVYVE